MTIHAYTKYKRLFTFGCSFTEYRFPTWANIMNKTMPSVEFYNFGKSGGGNTLIANRITEANMKYKFCETDLIMVMWTTVCREDRWLPSTKSWISPGNIYSQFEYSSFTTESYLKKYGTPITYLIRDLSTMEMTRSYLNSLPSDSFMMLSTPIDYQQDVEDITTTSMLETYKDLLNSFPPDMFSHELNGEWSDDIKYECFDKRNGYMTDYHPGPARYAAYLKKIGIHLTREAEEYASDAQHKLLTCVKHESDLYTLFPTESKINWGTMI